MVLFDEWRGQGISSVLGLCCSLQDDTPVCQHDCLVVNGTSEFKNIYLHCTAARMLTSGQPPETRNRVLTSGHPPGTQKHHLPSAVRAFMFLARRIQPFLPLLDCDVEFCVITIESFFSC